MNFQNAYDGIKKMINAQYFSLLSSLSGVVTMIIAASVVTTAIKGAFGGNSTAAALLGIGSGAIIFSLATLGLGIASIVFMIIGLVKAKSDEMNFQKALLFTFIALGCSLTSSVFSGVPFFSQVISLGGGTCTLIATYFVFQAIIGLSETVGEMAMVNDGKNSLKLYLIIKGVGILCSLLQQIITIGAVDTILSIIGIAATVLSTLVVLRYLLKARAMLSFSI